MGGGSWIVHEGFLLCRQDERAALLHESRGGTSHTTTVGSKNLQELYVVLTMNRKLEFFDGNDVATRRKVDSALVQGFAGWDGDGALKADAYGLELKVERNAKSRMYLAAFNRVDLEKWCRGFMAVLDPHSAAGDEVRRERRRVKKEEKREQEERDEKIRQWKEKKAKMIKEEQDRLLAREEEIHNMTPLERVDGLGSLDDDTARMLEKRKLRLQRRQAPTTGRVNKAAYRRRMEEAAGGRTDNVQPLHTKIVEQKAKVRVELPPPGHFFEVGGVVHNDAPIHLGSSGSDVSDSTSMSSRLSSVSSAAGSRYDGGTSNVPPPPPHWSANSSRVSMSSRASMGIPPPPPPLFDHHSYNDRQSRLSRSSSSLRSSSFDSFAFDRDEDLMASRSSFSQSRSRLLHVDNGKQNIQSNLAAILGGRRPSSASRASRTSHRRDSFGSTMSSIRTALYAEPERKSQTKINRSDGNNGGPPTSEPSMASAFAASLAAIHHNRADTVEEMSVANSAASPVASTRLNGRVRDRKRVSQLSAEGKEILKEAMSSNGAQDATSKAKTKSNPDRRGLFDDSSSDEDDGLDTGLFGVGGRQRAAANSASHASNSIRTGDLHVDARSNLEKKANPEPSLSSDEEGISSDSESDNETSFFAQPHNRAATSLRSVTTNNVGAGGAGPSVVVLFTTSALRTEGKKSVGVFTFTLQFGNLEHSFSFTYSEFEKIHTRLTSAFPDITLPKFPSKHRLRNNTRPENMEKRAQEFRLYLQQLVALPGVLSNERFHFEYHIDGGFAQAIGNDQKPTKSAANAARFNGRPPRSPVSPVSRQELAPPASLSRLVSPPVQTAKTSGSKGLFGLDDSDSDPESDSDTSVDTPKPLGRQQRHESAASLSQRRKPKKSELSSSGISLGLGEVQKSRSRTRLSSRASSRASSAPPPPTTEPPKPAVPGLLPGRPNPFAGGRSDLLAAIRQGAQLKKNTEELADGSSSGSASSIVKSSPLPPALTQPSSINEAITNAMAMRRIHVEYEETASNANSDSDDDWD